MDFKQYLEQQVMHFWIIKGQFHEELKTLTFNVFLELHEDSSNNHYQISTKHTQFPYSAKRTHLSDESYFRLTSLWLAAGLPAWPNDDDAMGDLVPSRAWCPIAPGAMPGLLRRPLVCEAGLPAAALAWCCKYCIDKMKS